jgi:hypothetical protein
MPTRRKSLAIELELAKRRGKDDFYYFTKYILGYDRLVYRHHFPLCHFLTKKVEKKQGVHTIRLILMPRGTYKSTIAAKALPLWLLLQDPNKTFLVTGEKLEKTKEIIKEQKGHIEDNAKFKFFYGDWSCAKKFGRKWTDDKIDVKPRTKISGTASVQMSSWESSETGKHVDCIVCDDLVGQSNVTSKELLDKVIAYWGELGRVLNPDGEMIVIGTRWDHRDLYNHILTLQKELGDACNIMLYIKAAEDEAGEAVFPEILPKPFLKQQRMTDGNYRYNCQYNNKITDSANALVKTINKYGNEIDGEPVSAFFPKCQHFVSVDLAYTESKTSDSTAIVVNAVDRKSGKWYIRHYVVLKTSNPDVVIDLLFDVNEKFKPVRYGIEKNNYISWLKKPLEDAMRHRGVFLPIDPPDGIPHYSKEQSKPMRLRGIAPRFNFGECFIAPEMTELEDQLLTLTYDGPRGHDDLLDALAMQNEIVIWGKGAVENAYDNEEVSRAGRAGSFASAWERLYGGREVDKDWLVA